VRVSPQGWRTVFDFRVQSLVRTKEKVRVSPQGWRTVFDFLSAKLRKKSETSAIRLFLVIFSSENALFLEIG
jgi:hypothetical protein